MIYSKPWRPPFARSARCSLLCRRCLDAGAHCGVPKDHAVTVALHSGDHTPWLHPITDTKSASASWQRKRKKKRSCGPNRPIADPTIFLPTSRTTMRLMPLPQTRARSNPPEGPKPASARVFAMQARRCPAFAGAPRRAGGFDLPETAPPHPPHWPCRQCL